jgi:hypothetical protein
MLSSLTRIDSPLVCGRPIPSSFSHVQIPAPDVLEAVLMLRSRIGNSLPLMRGRPSIHKVLPSHGYITLQV